VAGGFREVSVILGLRPSGHCEAYYDPVSMVFHTDYPILERCSPLEASDELKEQIISVAKSAAHAFHSGYPSVYAVEMFLTMDDEIFVNEVAPRVHNSGHHTIDVCEMSQFEMAARLALGMEMRSTALKYVTLEQMLSRS
jgi:5-(carboxyamino)imidazole ribonucleotide synthase